MMNAESRYNGWSNYETWAVNLWLTDDEGIYECIKEWAREALQQDIDNRSSAADHIKKFVDEMMPEMKPSLFSDLLQHAIGRVDWHEIADSHIDRKVY